MQPILKDRLFFESLAKELRILNYNEWGRISKKTIISFGGKKILSKYKNSLFRMFTQLFPEIEWKREWFNGINIHEKGFWRQQKNQQMFIESLAKKMNLKSHNDWGNIHVRTVKQNGGTGLIKLFGGSLFKSLKSAHPEIEWKNEWFPTVPKYNRSYFQSLQNQKRFLDEIALKYKFKDARDWKRATSSLIKKQGGEMLLKQYSGSLALALRSIFKEKEWEDFKYFTQTSVNKITNLFQ